MRIISQATAAQGADTLTPRDHSRDSAGMKYVYPVVSRRAGGVSIGMNLNPNNACNWRCVYCQVPNLKRGGPPPIDLGLLARELDALLDDILVGDFMARRVPEQERSLIDVAFSGNGEPTSAEEFPLAVELAEEALRRRRLLPAVKLRLITNGSLIDREGVQSGIRRLGQAGGEVWFKVDAADSEGAASINGVRLRMDQVERRLRECAGLCETWIQTCLFAFDGQAPSESAQAGLLALYMRLAGHVAGVHLYGLARPSLQPEARRLGRLAPEWMEAFGERIRREGLTVHVSP